MKDLGIGTHNVPTGRTRSSFAILLVILTIIGGLLYTATNATAADTMSLVVKLVDGLTPADQAAVIARNGGVETSSVPALRLHVVTVPTADQPLVQQNYQADAQVVSVEVNKTRKAEAIPTDANYGVQWALSKIGWESVFGTVVPTGTATLAILDTGVDATHPDLAGKVIPGTSILDGSNGLSDPSGHGTWLAGIAAAATDNGTGIAGIAFGGVQVMPVSVLNAGGIGQDSDIIAAIVWAVDHGADVILMGFSNPDFSQNLQDAIDYAWSKGAVLVAATGNDGVITPTFPAGDRGVIGVSATDQNDLLAPVSNYGQDTFLAAPGTDIYTTGPNGGYSYISGTSASSAFVAGAAALMKAVDPTLTNGVIVGRLARSADAIGTAGDPNNPTMFGNGRLNMANALADTGIDPVQPAGTPGGGGPFVGPYTAASVTSVTITSPTSPVTLTSLPATVTINFSYVTSITGTTTGAADLLGTSVTSSKSLTSGTGSDSFVLAIPASTANGTYNVKVTVTNETGTGSNQKNDNKNGLVVINVPACTAPSISNQPAGATRTVGESVTFSVTASGTAPLSYQWRKGGVNISGATSSSFTISSVVVADAGSYDVVVSNSCGSPASDAASLIVNKATPTITWENPAVITYGTPLGGTQLNATASVPGTFAYTPVAGTVLDAGNAQTLHVDFTPNDTTNYNNTSKDVSINVLKANATCSISGYTGAYDGNAHGATGSCTGVGGATLTGLDLGATYTNVPGGTAHWAFTGGTNYNDAIGDVTIIINKTNATINITPYEVIYDGNAHTATGTATGVKGEDLSGLTLGGTTHTNAGTYTDTWTFSDVTGNYFNASSTITDKIAKAPTTTTITVADATYDGNQHGGTATVTGAGGLNETLTTYYAGRNGTAYPSSATAPTNAGYYTAYAIFAESENYLASNNGKSFTIAKAPTTTTLIIADATYDGNPHGGTATVTGDGGLTQDVTIYYHIPGTDIYSLTPPINAGFYAAYANFAETENYLASSDGRSFTIAKAPTTTTVTIADATYDGNPHGGTATVTGAAGLKQEVPIYYHNGTTYSSTTPPTDAGYYAATAIFPGTDNYLASDASQFFTIAKAPTTMTLTVTDATYDGSPHGGTATVTGVAGLNQPLPIVYHGRNDTEYSSFTPPTNAGYYVADAVFAETENYLGSNSSQNFTINKANATINVTGYDGPYTATPHGATAIAKGVMNEDLGNLLHLASTTYTDVPGGSVTWTFDGNTNYNSASGSAEVKIAKVNATINVTGYDGPYTATSHGAVGTATGIAGADLNSLLHVDATTYTDVPGGSVSWTFDGNINYNPASGSTHVKIAKVNATINVTGWTGTYDGNPHGATGTATGISGADLNSLLHVAPTTYTNVSGGSVNWTFDGNTNYNAATGSAQVKIAKANATCTVTGYNVIFDGNDHSATGSCTGVKGESLVGLDLNGTTHKSVGPLPNYTYTDTWTFTDVTGNYNNTSGTVNDRIQAWTLNGFYQPVDMGINVLNTVKNGSTVPLKFEIFAGNTELTNVSAVQSVAYIEVVCSSFSTEDAIDEIVTTGGTTLRYDTTGGQFIDNWKTPSKAGKCYRVTMKTLDGSSLSAYFKLK